MKDSAQPVAWSTKQLVKRRRQPDNPANIKNKYPAFKNFFKLNLQQYRPLGDHISEGIWIFDNNGRTIYVNRKMASMLGYSLSEIEQISLFDCLDEDSLKLVNVHIQNPDGPQHQTISFQKKLALRQKDGPPLWFTVSVNHIFGITKKRTHVILIVSDISDGKLVEERLSRLNRVYSVLSHTHRAIIRNRNMPELCQEICRILVKDGLFKMVWIGMADFETNRVNVVAHYESDSGLTAPLYPLDLNNPDNQHAVDAIRAGDILTINDIEATPDMAPWCSDALRRGCRSVIILPIKAFNQVIGLLNLNAGVKDFFNEEEKELLMDLVDNLSYAIEFIKKEEQRQNALKALRESEDRLQDSYRHLNKVMIEIVKSFATTIETRDPYTAGHQERVSKLATAIAQEMGLPAAQIDAIILAATIHDIGKLFVPAEILNKPGRISDNEYKLIKTHPQIGYDIIKEIEFSWPIADIILQHHERLDGSGYPNQVAGDLILLEAKIIGVADVVEAMASHRPYRPALGIEKALEEISKNQGILYDPIVVDVCINLLQKFEFGFR